MSSSQSPPPPELRDTAPHDLPPSYDEISNDYVVPVPSSGMGEQTVSQQQEAGPGAQPPPAYNEAYGTIDVSEGGMDTKAQIADDGRINININQRTKRLSSLLTPVLRAQWRDISREPKSGIVTSAYEVPEFYAGDTPSLNILIQIIGSRGDVQPFIALGKVLKEKYHHRIRVATHPTFQGFVEENGLEFFSLGGDPSELMAFMVKNPGLMPGMDSLRAGDVKNRRKGMWEMLLGGWRACIEPGDGMGYRPSMDPGPQGRPLGRPFVADAIIANPPSFGHIHCAEKLGIPLHLMFTMPWSPTTAFPHPLANIQSTNVEPNLTNFLSYALVDMMTWQGLGDLVNKFRESTLGLEAVSTMWAPGMISRLKVPHTYCWSPTLIPKPDDWPSQINISGFFFLSLASSYTPPPELERFLNAGPPPVYIGFGSIVVDDPNVLTRTILEAVGLAGCRALVSKGWGGLGTDDLEVSEDIMFLGNCPHDWLFPQCAAVVHHGGAGTTAAGISCGKPTVIVPFFGDQPFWGAMVANSGAGPTPIPHKQLTSQNLASAIKEALGREMQAKAEFMGDSIRTETGAENGAKSFLISVEQTGLARCDLLPERIAVWKLKNSNFKLSALAASILVEANLIEGGYAGMRLWRHKEWMANQGPLEPISGGAGALVGTIGSIMMSVGDFPREIFKGFQGGKDKGKGVESPTTLDPPQGNLGTESKSSATAGASMSSDRSLASTASSSNTNVTTTSSDKGKGKESAVFDVEGAVGMGLGAGKGVSRIVGAGLRSPMDFTLGISQGFRNAPKLYGDEVRPESRVTGFHSGLKAAGKELSLGIYDGITGLVTQPIKGAKEEGAAGVFKGFGKGISGLVLKSGAGIWGLPAYAMKGVHQEILKLGTKDVSGYVTSARAAQGVHEMLQEPPQTRGLVVERWSQLQSHTAKRPLGWSRRATTPFGWDDKRRERNDLVDMRTYNDHLPLLGNTGVHHATHSHPQSSHTVTDEDDEVLQRVLRASTQSLGPPNRTFEDEDEELQRALRASTLSLPLVSHNVDEDEELQRALRVSTLSSPPVSHDVGDDEELREAIRISLLDSQSIDGSSLAPGLPPRESILEPEDDSVKHVTKSDSDDDDWLHLGEDEEFGDDGDDEEMARAVRESIRLEEERRAKREEEERVVMEYVVRASREEEELRRRRTSGF